MKGCKIMGPKAMKKGLVSYQTKQRRWAILIICYISKQWCAKNYDHRL